jgi:hypothetical protein
MPLFALSNDSELKGVFNYFLNQNFSNLVVKQLPLKINTAILSYF